MRWRYSDRSLPARESGHNSAFLLNNEDALIGVTVTALIAEHRWLVVTLSDSTAAYQTSPVPLQFIPVVP